MPVHLDTICAISSGPTSSFSIGSDGVSFSLDWMDSSISESAPYLHHGRHSIKQMYNFLYC